jgi:hypothetical protein
MEWNRREFIVKPIMLAGTASVLGKTDLLTKLASDWTADPADAGQDGIDHACGQHGRDER